MSFVGERHLSTHIKTRKRLSQPFLGSRLFLLPSPNLS